MKKKLFIIFSLFIAFFFFGFIKLRASGTITMTDGASIRTDAPAGLRFEATISGEFEGSTVEYGFVLSRGEFTKTQMESKLASGKAIKVPCGEPDGKGKIYVSITNIPESAYSSDITAIAYVNVDDEDFFADIAVTRNITEVATAYAGLIDSDFIDAIVNCNTHMVKTTLATTNEFVLTHIVSKNYGFSDLEFLWADFINDFNKATGSSINANTVDKDSFWTAMSSGIASTSLLTIPSDSNAVKFFKGVNLVKWGWILEFFTTHGTIHVNNQAEALLRSDRTCQRTSGVNRLPCHQLKHLTGGIWNLFHNSYILIGGMDNYSFATEDKYSDVPFPSKTDLSGDNVVNVGDNIDLPAAITPADGYNWSCYKVGETSYVAEDSYEVTTSEVAFVPTFTPITYSITYYENGGSAGANPTTYDIETATINLIDGTKSGYVFVGWYTDALFSNPITQIVKGSTGNIDLYAKFVREVSIVNQEWSGTENGTPVHYDDKDYTFGTDAFATIASALAAASEYEQIYVLAGEYSETFTISTNGVSLIGPKDGVLGNSGSRTTGEAEFTSGTITLGKNLANCTITGFKFSGTSKIVNTNGDAGTSENPATNLNGFTFSYNKVISGLTSGNGFIEFSEAASSYSHNLVFRGNSFTQSSTGVSAMIYLDNNANLSIIDNSFNSITGDAVYVTDTTKGLAGNLTVTGNSFVSITKGAVFCNWYSPLPGTSPDILVSNNYFKDVDGGACVNFEKCNGGDNYNSFIIELNVFDDVFKVYWVYTSSQTGSPYGSIFRNNVVFKYAGGLTGSYMAKGGYIDCASNLYLSADGSTIYTTTASSNFSFGAYAGNVDSSNYESIEAYNSATGQSFSLNS